LVAGLVGAGLLSTGALAADQPAAARASLAVASLAVGLWGSELLPLPATALLAMALLAASGAVDRTERALVGLSSPVLAFLLGSAGLGIAAELSGLADRLAARLVARAGRVPSGRGWRVLSDLLLTMPLQALVAPSAMSRNAILVPLYERVLVRLGRPPRLGAAVMLTLGVLGPLASSMLLSGGTSPVAAATLLGGFTWLSWLVALGPVYCVLIAVDAVALWLIAAPEREVPAPQPWSTEATPIGGAERRVALATVATSALWMADALTGWSPALPALLALVALLAPGVGTMGWSAFAGRAPWGTCVVLAGAVSLADALARSGAASWLAGRLFGLLPSPGAPGAVAAALAVYLVTAVITLAIPNRAAAITLCIPLALAYAAATPLPLAASGLIVMIAVDAETIYPAQTAANLIAYERGYFGAGLLARYNALTLLLGAAVVVFVALPWWGLIGLPAVRSPS
jgi:di/tricarboxylate transporter